MEINSILDDDLFNCKVIKGLKWILNILFILFLLFVSYFLLKLFNEEVYYL